jgi:hypothetical protein
MEAPAPMSKREREWTGAPVVPMNPAERLINFIVHHTKLKLPPRLDNDAGWYDVFKALSPWLAELQQKVRAEEREACATAVEMIVSSRYLASDLLKIADMIRNLESNSQSTSTQSEDT